MADNFLNYTGLGYFKDKCDAEYTNVIETVKLNGTALTPDANKAVNVEAATVTVPQGDPDNIKIGVPGKYIELYDNEDGTIGIVAGEGGAIDTNLASREYVEEYGGKIDEIQLNGTALTITDKAVNIEDFTYANLQGAGKAGLVPAPRRAASPDSVTQFLTSRYGWQKLFAFAEIGSDGSPSQGRLLAGLRYGDPTQPGYTGSISATFPRATTTADGVMSSTDKTKLDSLPTSDDVDAAIADALANSGDPYLPESDIDDKIAAAQVSVLDYKGAVATYDDLPSSGNKKGDVWDVQDTGINYAWSGTAWDALGTSVDTSSFWTSTTGQSNTLVAITTSQIDSLFE